MFVIFPLIKSSSPLSVPKLSSSTLIVRFAGSSPVGVDIGVGVGV